jgi:hypothetical protein
MPEMSLALRSSIATQKCNRFAGFALLAATLSVPLVPSAALPVLGITKTADLLCSGALGVGA